MTTLKYKEETRKEKSLKVEPIGKARKSFLLEEIISQNFPIDDCHDGGWEKVEKVVYISNSQIEALNLLDKLIAKRKREGWKLEKILKPYNAELLHSCYYFKINYFLNEENIVWNG
jgi:hypothetical protein